jgi:hypothetical protein
MRHHHHVIADLACARHIKRLAEMQRDLVAEEVEIDPGVGGTAFGATDDVTIEASCFVKIGDVVGEMEK